MKSRGRSGTILFLRRKHVDEMFAHARSLSPAECCGLIGGREGVAQNVYPLDNIAADKFTAYEAAPEDLFGAQKKMRAQGERLLGIYHSHPRQADPVPSATDVRLAYYESAIYFIIGLGHQEPALAAFRLYEREGRWERVEYKVTDG